MRNSNVLVQPKKAGIHRFLLVRYLYAVIFDFLK